MAYDSNFPANDDFLSEFPPRMREQIRAIIEDELVNALKLRGYYPGNANGNIPVSNGTRCANLNADQVDGKDATDFAMAGHSHVVATASSDGYMSSTDKVKLEGISTGAEVNQNAFSIIKIGSAQIQADAKQDTLTMEAGAGITITPDATNDKITISFAGEYLPKSGGVVTGAIYRSGEFVLSPSANSWIRLTAGEDYSSGGGSVCIWGKEHASSPGEFRLRASDGQNAPFLVGKPDGTLTWNGSSLVHNIFVKSGNNAKQGLVPKPPTTAGATKFLREDGTWAAPPNDNTTYAAGTAAVLNTGTDTVGKVWSAKILANAFATMVKTSGTQTIGGEKTFTSNQYLSGTGPVYYIRNTNETVDATPTSQTAHQVRFVDKNNVNLGSVAHYHTTAGAHRTALYTRGESNNSYTFVGIERDKNGTAYGLAPTPPSTSNEDHIATTKWVRSLTGGIGISAAKIDANGYVKFTNGLIIQWGTCVSGTAKTFPTAFASECYAVTITSRDNDHQYEEAFNVKNLTKTGFMPQNRYNNFNGRFIAIGK